MKWLTEPVPGPVFWTVVLILVAVGMDNVSAFVGYGLVIGIAAAFLFAMNKVANEWMGNGNDEDKRGE